MTYSIVARDQETGALGVAVQSAVFGIGVLVPWARPGVGVVATQAAIESAYGPRCLEAMATGATAHDALAGAHATDAAAVLRQVGLVAADGTAAAFTGAGCIPHAGHVVGDGWAVQANMMGSPRVWPAMAETFRGGTGPLAHRLLAALDAAQAVGGDAGGVMSAALVVVDGERGEPWSGPLVDVRVDSSRDPLGELRRLLHQAEAYTAFWQAAELLGGGQPQAALDAAARGLRLSPDDENLRFVRAGAPLACGEVTAGADILRHLLRERPTWGVIVRAFALHGLPQIPPEPLDELVETMEWGGLDNMPPPHTG